tara:strand:+ start:820 stop:972 length:153 start_codon:yes stop_codon:yes gene_type:complete
MSNFAMIQHHGWSLQEINDMMPFEKSVYVQLLKNWIDDENIRIKRQNKGS